MALEETYIAGLRIIPPIGVNMLSITTSYTKHVTHGSILGPLLFIIYMSDFLDLRIYFSQLYFQTTPVSSSKVHILMILRRF